MSSGTETFGIRVSFPVERPCAAKGILPVVTAEDAWYDAIYRYELRGSQWWAVLERLEEIMPARTPQVSRYDDSCRLHMMHEDGSLDFEAEAKQRRKEWAEVANYV